MKWNLPLTTHTRSLTRTLAVAITTTVTFGLLGCSAGAEPTDTQSAPTAAVSTAPVAPTEESEPAEEAAPTETPAPETGNSSLPADFPASVPLVSEKIERTKDHNNNHNNHGEWVVWVTVDDISAAAVTARGQLTAAGFAEESWYSSERETKGVFKSADYGVVLVAVDTPNHREFMYKVFTK